MSYYIRIITCCIFLNIITSCSSYYVNAKRSEGVLFSQLKNMNYEIGSANISYDGNTYRQFAIEEQCLIDEFNKDMKKNFYNKLTPSSDNTMIINLIILAQLKEETYICGETTTARIGSALPRRGLLAGPLGSAIGVSLSHSNTNYKTCTRYKTIFDVSAKGIDQSNNRILFETNIKYDNGKVYNTQDRIAELKHILNKITIFIGRNFTDLV